MKHEQQVHHNCHNSELVVNPPRFDRSAQDENDIYVFSGYFEPKCHWVGIYDPVLDKYLKKKNIYVYPRTIDLVHNK